MNEKRNEQISAVKTRMSNAVVQLELAVEDAMEIDDCPVEIIDRLKNLASQMNKSDANISKKLAKIESDEAKAAAKVERGDKAESKKQAKIVKMKETIEKLNEKLGKLTN